MPYVRRSGSRQLSADTVLRLAECAALPLPPEDVEPLAAALTDQLVSVEAFNRLDLTDVNPVTEFDPRWSDGREG